MAYEAAVLTPATKTHDAPPKAPPRSHDYATEPPSHEDEFTPPRFAARPFATIPLFAPPPSGPPAKPLPLQRKLSIGATNDPLEYEADRVAAHILRTPPDTASARSIRSGPPAIARSASATPTAAAAPPSVHQVLSTPGQPLDAASRSFMEPRFGHDFSSIRIHTDNDSAHAADAIGAVAFTHRNDIFFGASSFQPETREGRKLLAHELTHTLQQRQATSENARFAVGPDINYPSFLPSSVIRRSPKTSGKSRNYICSGVDLVGHTLTFHGDQGDVSVQWKISTIPAPGSYTASAVHDESQGRLIFHTEADLEGAEIDWENDHDQDLFEGYLESLGKKPVRLTIYGSGSGGGAGANTQPGSTDGSAGGTGTPNSAGGSKTQGEQGDQGSGSNAGSQTTGGKTQPDKGNQSGSGAPQEHPYPDKLQSVSDLPGGKELTADQTARLKALLDQMSDDDLAKFHQYAKQNPGGDPEHLIASLQAWLTLSKQLEDKPAPSSADAPDQTDPAQQQLAQQDDQILDQAVKHFSPNDVAKNETLARDTIEKISNDQLKNLSAKDIAEGVIRVDKQLKGAGTDMSEGLDDAITGNNAAEHVAGGARALKGAAIAWAIFSVAAMFVPGLNIAVLTANAMAAGLVAYAALTVQKEAEIKAAAQAKDPQNFEKHVKNGIEARNQFVIQTVVLALPLAGRLFQAIPIPRGLSNLATRLRTSANALKASGAEALQSSRASALEAVQQFRQSLAPYSAQIRATVGGIIKRLRNSSDFIAEVQKIPELQDLIPPDEIKTLQALPPDQLKIAEQGILSDLDNSPALAANLLKSLDERAASIEKSVQSATDPGALQTALDTGADAAEPKTAGVAAEKQALVDTIQQKGTKLANLTASEVRQTLTDLRNDVNNLPNTNANRADVLRELDNLRREAAQLEKARPGPHVSDRLEAINQRAEELDDLVADDVVKARQSTAPTAKPAAPASTPTAPAQGSGGKVSVVVRHTDEHGSIQGAVHGPMVPAEAKLVSIANDAINNTPQASTPQVTGTNAHTLFAHEIQALGDPNISAEVSYLKGKIVPYGTDGSSRFDAIVGPKNAPTAAYDLKTGSDGITAADIAKMRSNLPAGSTDIPINEIGK